MPNREDILWFKQQFQARIRPALAGTPLTVDFIAAIACQETGHIWSVLRKKGLSADQVLALCVGDTLDADKGRRAFPTTAAELKAAPRGEAMFALARQALLDMADQIPGFEFARNRPAKFCHAFGIFQRDLQFFPGDPDYFLNRDWAQFERAITHCVGELKRGLRKLGLTDRTSLTDLELCAVGIAYNTGGFVPSKGLKQGHSNGTQYYGEALMDFLRLSQTVPVDGEAPVIAPPRPGVAIIAPPQPLSAGGPRLRVRTQTTVLRVRSEPRISVPAQANVVGQLPDGHIVQSLGSAARNGFVEIETQLQGARLRGWASQQFLVPLPSAALAPMRGMARGPRATTAPAMSPEPAPVRAAALTRPEGLVTTRRALASAQALNEARQPGRTGTEAAQLRAEMDAIIDWLSVDKPTYKRWQAHQGEVFSNVYAQDVCQLAGVYLPRVWWTGSALLAWAAGGNVQPLIGDTVQEMNANDLFSWLRDHGPAFGWRQAASATELQTEVNQGAVGLIVARRKQDGRSGHISLVVPETGAHAARRSRTGEVTAPLQSQAHTRNTRRGPGKPGWWKDGTYAASAFWLQG